MSRTLSAQDVAQAIHVLDVPTQVVETEQGTRISCEYGFVVQLPDDREWHWSVVASTACPERSGSFHTIRGMDAFLLHLRLASPSAVHGLAAIPSGFLARSSSSHSSPAPDLVWPRGRDPASL